MIESQSEAGDFAVRYGDGVHTGLADAAVGSGGQGAGFTPHMLLEAALGSCINITARMYAKRKGIPLEGVVVRVEESKTLGGGLAYDLRIDFRGPLCEDHLRMLRAAADACPVKKALSRPAEFRWRGDASPAEAVAGA